MDPRRIFHCDYNDKDAVIALAREMNRRHGGNYTVFKHPDRTNYNVCHTERTDQYKPEWVVCQVMTA